MRSRISFAALVVLMFLSGGLESVHAQLGLSRVESFDPAPVEGVHRAGTTSIASDQRKTWVSVWSARTGDPNASDFDIVFSRSSDGGQNWSQANFLHDDMRSDSRNDFRPQLVQAGNEWVVVWDSKNGLERSLIMYSSSGDDGVTWSAPQPIPSAGVPEDSSNTAPAIAGRSMEWVVTWESNAPDGSQRVFVSRSNDNGETWGDAQPLDVPGADFEVNFNPAIGSDGSGTYVVAWSHQGDSSNVLNRRSTDGGVTWLAPARAHATPPGDGQDFLPTVLADRSGAWVIAWESGVPVGGSGMDQDILFVRSGNNGQTWTAPATLNSNANDDEGFDGAPILATDGLGNWIAVWEATGSVANVAGEDRDLMVAASTDGASTWSAASPLSSLHFVGNDGEDRGVGMATDARGRWIATWISEGDPGESDVISRGILEQPLFWARPEIVTGDLGELGGNDFDPELASDGQGRVVAVWSSTKSLNRDLGTDRDILVMTSSDGGGTWSAPGVLNTNAAADVGGDRNPAIAWDGAGTWIVTWDSDDTLGGTIGADQDILAARSTDGGATWSAPSPVNDYAVDDEATDFGASVAAGSDGRVAVAWQSNHDLDGAGEDEDILLTRSTDGGATWQSARLGNLNARADEGGDFDPEIRTDGLDVWLLAWMSNDPVGDTLGDDDDIVFSRSVDGGNVWSDPLPLNATATDDGAEEDDFSPAITTDGLGSWVAVWHSEATLGETIGPDGDILTARSSDNGATWSAVRPVSVVAEVDLGEDTDARVATDGFGRWMATWTSRDTTVGGNPILVTDSDIALAVSLDDGETWTLRTGFNMGSHFDTSSESMPDLIYSGSGWAGIWTSQPNIIGSQRDLVSTFSGDLNLPPRVTSAPDIEVEEGIPANLSQIVIAGELPKVTIDWGDGSVELVVTDGGGTSVLGGHVYGRSGVFEAKLMIEDEGGLSTETTFLVTVVGKPAVVFAGPNQTFVPGFPMTLSDARIADPGSLEGLKVTIDWGDGTSEPAEFDPATGEVFGTHLFEGTGPFTVSVLARDGEDESVDSFFVSQELSIEEFSYRNGVASLDWSGGVSPFTIESTDDPQFPVWDAALETGDSAGAVDVPGDSGFLRIVSSPVSEESGRDLNLGSVDPSDPVAYAFGHGGDVTIDGLLDGEDVAALIEGLQGSGASFAAYDIDQNGTFGVEDVHRIMDIYSRRIPSCFGAEFVQPPPDSSESAELRVFGWNWDPKTTVLIDGAEFGDLPVFINELGSYETRIPFEPGTGLTEASEIQVVTGGAITNTVPVRFNTEAVIEQEVPENLNDELGTAPRQAAVAAKDDCCIERLVFSPKIKGLSISAFDESGRLATGSGRALNKDTTLRRGRDATPGTPKCVTIIVSEGKGRNAKIAAQYTFSCASLKKLAQDNGVMMMKRTVKGSEFSGANKIKIPLRETFAPRAAGEGSQVRPRTLFCITGIVLRENCGKAPARPLAEAIHKQVKKKDNEKYPGSDEFGSGAVAEFGVRQSDLATLGCELACWLQIVTTRIDLQKKGSDKRATIVNSDWHNDYGVPEESKKKIKAATARIKALDRRIKTEPNSRMRSRLKSQRKRQEKERCKLVMEAIVGNGEKPWWCYKAEIAKWRPIWMGVGDGPHIKHRRDYPLQDGTTVRLEKGDTIVRQSTFFTSLICLKPERKILITYLWSITTSYVHDPANLTAGGKTEVTQPVEVTLIPPAAKGAFMNNKGKVIKGASSYLKKGLSPSGLQDFLKKRFENSQ